MEFTFYLNPISLHIMSSLFPFSSHLFFCKSLTNHQSELSLFSDPDYFFHGFYVSFIFGGVPSWVLLDICGIPLKRGTVMQVRSSVRSVVILSTRPIYVCWWWGGKFDRNGIWITWKKPYFCISWFGAIVTHFLGYFQTWGIGKRIFYFCAREKSEKYFLENGNIVFLMMKVAIPEVVLFFSPDLKKKNRII